MLYLIIFKFQVHRSSHHVFAISVISYYFSAVRISISLAGYLNSWHCSIDFRKRIHLLSLSLHSLFTAQLSLNSKIRWAVLWKTSNIVYGLSDLSSRSISSNVSEKSSFNIRDGCIRPQQSCFSWFFLFFLSASASPFQLQGQQWLSWLFCD